jgi:hypothetical protein
MTKERRLYWVSGAIGVAYGLTMRGLQWTRLGKASFAGPIVGVMSIAFIAVVPFAMGYLSVAVKARHSRVSIRDRVFVPWLVVVISLAASLALLWEGIICIVMLTPLALLCGTLGGLLAGSVVKPLHPQAAAFSMILIALLPVFVGPVERRVGAATDVRSVESQVVIRASAQTVWRNIERVRAIGPNELPRSWNRTIGFPRPLEATLSHEGLGGIRHATFEGGVLFIETIDVWQPQQRLGFSIRADSQHIPATTLDEHVRVGGPYFDVLHGEYILETQPDGTLKLRLVSRHRVSTDFNWYARWWTDAVMRDVQRSILYVIRNRCEPAAH